MDDRPAACPQCGSHNFESYTAGEYFHTSCRRCGRSEDGNADESLVKPGRGVLRYEPADPERHAPYVRPLRDGDDLSALISRRTADPRLARIVLTYRTPEGVWSERVVFGTAATRTDRAA